MSTAHPADRPHDPQRLGHNSHTHGRDAGERSQSPHGHSEATGHGQGGPSSKRIIVGYGFWIFLLSDIVMFSAFFAAYAVLGQATAGGPSGRQLFDLPNVAIETGCC